MRIETRIGVVVVRLRVVHKDALMRNQSRALKNIERDVLSGYQATVLCSAGRQLTIA
jgi:hypothetical protein